MTDQPEMRSMDEYAASIRHVPMPDRIRRLPLSPKNMPVPWFVAFIDGVPDFRVIGPGKIAEAWKRHKCWVCGDVLGANLAMTLGPMCAINRTISEPPAHRECAIYSCMACPFLSNPRMRRNERGLPDDGQDAAGFGIKRNPGAVAVWITRGVWPFKVHNGVLFTFDDPTEVLWFANGREATRAEVDHSISTGLPILFAEAEKEGPSAVAALRKAIARAEQYLPREAVS
jgi:hypothetical protein